MEFLNHKTQKRLREVLDETAFAANNFRIEFGEDTFGRDFLARIEFIGNIDYFYLIDQNFLVRFRPGETYSEGELRNSSLEVAFNSTRIWIGYIISNLRAGSPMNLWEETWAAFQKHLEEQELDEKAYFTPEERTDILDRLSKLEADLRTIFTDNNATEDEVVQLEATFDELETAVDYSPKMTWYRSCIGKVSTFGRKFVNSPIGIALLAKAVEMGATKLLGP
jgi:hypothetical protein